MKSRNENRQEPEYSKVNKMRMAMPIVNIEYKYKYKQSKCVKIIFVFVIHKFKFTNFQMCIHSALYLDLVPLISHFTFHKPHNIVWILSYLFFFSSFLCLFGCLRRRHRHNIHNIQMLVFVPQFHFPYLRIARPQCSRCKF